MNRSRALNRPTLWPAYPAGLLCPRWSPIRVSPTCRLSSVSACLRLICYPSSAAVRMPCHRHVVVRPSWRGDIGAGPNAVGQRIAFRPRSGVRHRNRLSIGGRRTLRCDVNLIARLCYGFSFGLALVHRGEAVAAYRRPARAQYDSCRCWPRFSQYRRLAADQFCSRRRCPAVPVHARRVRRVPACCGDRDRNCRRRGSPPAACCSRLHPLPGLADLRDARGRPVAALVEFALALMFILYAESYGSIRRSR